MKIGMLLRHSRDVSGLARQAGNQLVLHRIGRPQHHNGDRGRGTLRRLDRCGGPGNDDIDLQADQIFCQSGKPFQPPFSPSILHGDALALDPAGIPQAFEERFILVSGSAAIQVAYKRRLSWLLSGRRRDKRKQHSANKENGRAQRGGRKNKSALADY